MYNPTKPAKHTVLQLIRETWNNPLLEVHASSYAIFKQNHDMYEVDHSDGIGTKGYYHWKQRSFRSAVLDSLAMNLNDLALVGATAYKLQNHIVLPADDDEAVIAIVSELVDECKKRGIVVTGGETSIHNTADGLDIGMTVSGVLQKLPHNKSDVGDVVIGLPSNGLHSNGFTRVRELFGDTKADLCTIPTTIYADTILEAAKEVKIHGMMHITGGAFTKLKDIIIYEDIIISRNHTLRPQQVFYDLYKAGVSDSDMYATFNCGIGFVVTVSKKDADRAAKLLGGTVIGEVTKGTGVVQLDSVFSEVHLRY